MEIENGSAQNAEPLSAPEIAPETQEAAPEKDSGPRDTQDVVREAIAKAREKAASTDEPTADGRARDEAGRFKAAEKAEAAKQQAPLKADEAQQKPVAQPDAPLVVKAPAGWSVAAKAAFDTLPQPVKEAVAQREADMNRGLAALEEYKGLKRYSDEAKAGGRSLGQVMDAYRAAEQTLETNFPQGVENLCRIYNIHPARLAQMLMQKFAPNQQQRPQQQQAPQQRQQFTDPRVDGILARFQQEENNKILTQIDQFMNDPANKYAANVQDEMADIIEFNRQRGRNVSLADAYQTACANNPEIRELLIQERIKGSAPKSAASAAIAAQAKSAAKTTTGAPSGGSPPSRSAPPPKSVHDAVRAAVNAARNA